MDNDMGDLTEWNTHLRLTGFEVIRDGDETFLMPSGGNRVCLPEF